MELEEFRLGETAGMARLQGLDELKFHLCHMAGQSRKRLLIYSHRLNPDLYNRCGFIEAVRQLVIRHPSTRVQILVADTAELVRGGHRLLSLAQDLTSSIAIRHRNEEYEGDLRSFLLADDEGYLIRPIWHDLNNVRADYSARPVVRNLVGEFQRAWECSDLDPALRRLHL